MTGPVAKVRISMPDKYISGKISTLSQLGRAIDDNDGSVTVNVHLGFRALLAIAVILSGTVTDLVHNYL